MGEISGRCPHKLYPVAVGVCVELRNPRAEEFGPGEGECRKTFQKMSNSGSILYLFF
jgi:hypothetical protein